MDLVTCQYQQQIHVMYEAFEAQCFVERSLDKKPVKIENKLKKGKIFRRPNKRTLKNSRI